MNRNVFLVPVVDKWLLHAPLHHFTALLNSKAVDVLASNRQISGSVSIKEIAEGLRKQVEPEPVPKQGSLNPDFLGIITTRTCNMDCAYCGFGSHYALSDSMDLQLAVAAVDWMAQQVKEREQQILEIHFFGGEPFCAEEVISTAVHRARMIASRMELIPVFEVATNGFHSDVLCRFMGDYFDTVILSLDGPEDIQNRQRPMHGGKESFQKVAECANILGHAAAELFIRVCVTQDTVKRMEEIGRWLCERFQPSVINFETLKPNAESERAGLLPPDPWEMAAHYIQTARIVERFGTKAVYAASDPKSRRLTFCPVGTDTIIVSPDGRVSACYLPQEEWISRGLNMDMGFLEKSGQINLDQQIVEKIRDLISHKSRCRKCLARWHCAGGCHVDHSFPGCSEDYNAFCIQTRIILACDLLYELGCGKMVETLLSNRRAMEALVFQPSDVFLDVS